MIIQIYEITSPEEARALSRMGVDHIGVLVGNGSFPREQSVEVTREIFADVQAPSKTVALSLSADTRAIGALAEAVRPAVLHLGA
ncbi:MAG: phosphoribosylanthranilate isomerase, partial [Xanthobacteraceae bacterium]